MMTLLQAIPDATGATSTIISEWGVPGAFIVLLILAIGIGAKWLARRENLRVEYDKIQRKKDEDRYLSMQHKWEEQVSITSENNVKLTDIVKNNTEVVMNNSKALEYNSESFKHLLDMQADRQEFRDFIKKHFDKYSKKG